MKYLHDLISKIKADDIPTGVLGVLGIVLFLLAVRAAKGLAKFVFVTLALAAFAVAVWWHLQKR